MTCPDCGGSGRIENDAWAGFREKHIEMYGSSKALCDGEACTSVAEWLRLDSGAEWLRLDSGAEWLCPTHAEAPIEEEWVACSSCNFDEVMP